MNCRVNMRPGAGLHGMQTGGISSLPSSFSFSLIQATHPRTWGLGFTFLGLRATSDRSQQPWDTADSQPEEDKQNWHRAKTAKALKMGALIFTPLHEACQIQGSEREKEKKSDLFSKGPKITLLYLAEENRKSLVSFHTVVLFSWLG